MQCTIDGEAHFQGSGLFSGNPVDMKVGPAGPGSGISFVREDLDDAPDVSARWENVVNTDNRVVIGDANGARVATIEHLMAAFAGLGIDNARVSLSGEEVPVMDGSSAKFIVELERAGVSFQGRARSRIRILRPVEVLGEDRLIRIEPAENFSIDGTIDYPGTAIGKQRMVFSLERMSFQDHLADSRTFCTLEDATRLRDRNRGLGGTLANTLVVNGEEVLAGCDLRHEDEFVRHKILDCVGDLYLAGAQIQGRVTFVHGGHRMNVRLLEEIFSDPRNWERVDESDLLSAAA